MAAALVPLQKVPMRPTKNLYFLTSKVKPPFLYIFQERFKLFSKSDLDNIILNFFWNLLFERKP